jgi:hypothetical protein
VNQSGGQAKLLSHAARERLGAAIGELGKTDEFEDLFGARHPIRGWKAAHLGEEAQVFQHRELTV